MSARALTWCWRQTPRTSSQKLVLAALADRADDDGECFPSTEWIAEKCKPLSRQAAKRALAELAEQGFVEKTKRRRRDNGTLGTWLLRLPLDVDVVGQRSLVISGSDSQRSQATSGVEPDQGSPVIKPEVTGDTAETSIETTTTKTSPDGEVGESGKRKRARRQDPLWDVFAEVCGFSPTTRNGRGKWNAGLAQLREAGATADTLKAAIKAYRKEWPCAEVSPTAIATWWDKFAPGEGAVVTSTDAALAWARAVGWRYDGVALDDEIDRWTAQGVDAALLREAVTTARPPIERLAEATAS